MTLLGFRTLGISHFTIFIIKVQNWDRISNGQLNQFLNTWAGKTRLQSLGQLKKLKLDNVTFNKIQSIEFQMLSKRNVGRSDRHLQMTSVHYNFEKGFYEIILHEFDYFYVAKVLDMIICGNRAFSEEFLLWRKDVSYGRGW